MIYAVPDTGCVTAAQLKLIKNLKQTNKVLHYRISSLAASSHSPPDQYALIAAVLNRGYEVENEMIIDHSN